MHPARTARLPAYALFAALLAAAGLPIYIHAPKYYVDTYGVSLTAIGVVLFALRMFDFVQDPALGWLVGRLRARQRLAAALGVLVMVLSMLGLFAVPAPFAPLGWFALCLTGLFSAFSFLTILFYARGVAKAEEPGSGGHLRLAAWRETGALVGVCLAAVAPALAIALLPGVDPFVAFAAGFAALALAAAALMRAEWQGRALPGAIPGAIPGAVVPGAGGFRAVLADGIARRLLAIALVNAAPVAVTSTLFLFFVEYRLDAPGLEGPFLLLFFLAAAVSAPLWGRAAQRHGARRMLLWGMGLSIVAFGFAALLGPGDLLPFAIICIASGAALGADMTLLPALFATRLAQMAQTGGAPSGGPGFGLWNFVTKFTLALAAITLLPALSLGGFQAGAQNPDSALRLLGALYALVPCGLKLLAIALLSRLDLRV